MIIVRPAKKKDADHFVKAPADVILGMTSIPLDRTKLSEKISHSESSFLNEVTSPADEDYLFVLEDLATATIAGTAGIFATVSEPESYLYKEETLYPVATHPAIPSAMNILKPYRISTSISEMCALYVHQDYLHGGLGRLLSLSRFLFIAAFPKRVHNKVIAALRGYLDENSHSPFWDGFGKQFCNLSFPELMHEIERDSSLISMILPHFPIYIDLLPKKVRESIGKTHEKTLPALKMLLHENFNYIQLYDILDGGPIVSANTDKIRAVKESALIKIETTDSLPDQDFRLILSNNRVDFRACYGKLRIINPENGVIERDVAEALEVNNGDTIRYVRAH